VEREKKTILESVANARNPFSANEEPAQTQNTEVNTSGGTVE
jgi:hypothetical protein